MGIELDFLAMLNLFNVQKDYMILMAHDELCQMSSSLEIEIKYSKSELKKSVSGL